MKYFTFCATGALDVLLLNKEDILKRSKDGFFDNVYFFNYDENAIIETRNHIPGAVGFSGQFFDILLDSSRIQGLNGLEIPRNRHNERAVREQQKRQDQRSKFIEAFPFDIINMDVERYVFQPSEQLPGKLVASLKEVFINQLKPGSIDGRSYYINSFTLFFTTQVGPQNLTQEYMQYLKDVCIKRNIEKYAELGPKFDTRSGGRSVDELFQVDFDAAFKIAVPKSLADLAYDNGWVIDEQQGIQIFQFDRAWAEGSYRMLHMAMSVKRQSPEPANRGPGQGVSENDEASHRAVVNTIFEQQVASVEQAHSPMKDNLQTDLDRLFSYRESVMEGED